jgi:hypothetical protein
MTWQISNLKMPVQHFNVSKLSSDNISLCQIAKNILYLHAVYKKDDIIGTPVGVVINSSVANNQGTVQDRLCPIVSLCSIALTDIFFKCSRH